MKITVVYDNCLSQTGLRTGWGFAAFIESAGAPSLLFDTGADGATLLYNMKQLDIAPGRIQKIVISHAHGDHAGGLADLLEINSTAEIYVPASTSATIPGRKVIPVKESMQISVAVFSTGELNGIEQSLAIKTVKGVVVVVGCSHPGLGPILEAAARYGTIYGIIGGLHDCSDFNRLRGLSLICPCHCTMYQSAIRHLFPEQYVACGTGLKLEL